MDMDHNIDITSLNSLKHSVGTLQQSISKILELAPNNQVLKSLKLDPNVGDIIKGILENPKIQLASELKTRHENGELQLFEDIKQFNGDGFQFHQLKRVPIELNSTKDAAKKQDAPTEYPPSLPPVTSNLLISKVFTHRSMIDSNISKLEAINSTNERLEFLGDSFLNTFISQIIFEYFPNIDEGRLTQLRSDIVCNSNLVNWSKLYSFDEKLQKDLDEALFQTGKLKLFADVFEAYVGALILDSSDQTYSHIIEWLRNLSMPLIKDFQFKLDHNQGERLQTIKLDNYTNELYGLIGYARNPPVYRKISQGNGTDKSFQIAVYVGDEKLGTGCASNVKEAKRLAAKDALENHKDLIEKHHLIRLEMSKLDSQISHKESSGVKHEGPETKKTKIQDIPMVPVNQLLEPNIEMKFEMEKFKRKFLTNFVIYNRQITLCINDILLASCVSEDLKLGKRSLMAWYLNTHEKST